MSGAKSAALPNREAALRGLYDDVARGNMFPFWATSTDVENDEIKQLMGTKKAVPHMWRYSEDIEPLLHRAADLIKMDDSERRSLILINPGLAPKRWERGASARGSAARTRQRRRAEVWPSPTVPLPILGEGSLLTGLAAGSGRRRIGLGPYSGSPKNLSRETHWSPRT